MKTNKLLKKLIPSALAAALVFGAAVPSGLSIGDIADEFTIGASAEANPYNVRYGASIGSEIGVKLVFTPGDEVLTATLTDPDDDSVVDTVTDYGTEGDKAISVKVFPKNMDKTMTFTIKKNGEEVFTKKFTVNKYLDDIKDSVKDSSNDKEKALYDLCTALENYGAWTKCYFYTDSQPPADGAYNNDNQPAYPSWWSGTDEDYWKTDLGIGDKTLPEYLNNITDTATVNYGGTDAEIGVAKMTHNYTVSMLLDEEVKIRMYFKHYDSPYTPGIRLTTGPLGSETTVVFDMKQYVDTTGNYPYAFTRKFVQTSGIKIGELSVPLHFHVTGAYVDNYDLVDTISLSPLGYAKLVDTKRFNDMTYEKNGLANAMRALVTVDLAARNYGSVS